jgi:hypothetical protein
MQKGHHPSVVVLGSVLSKSSQGNGQVVVSFRNEDGDTIDAYLSLSDAAYPWTEKKLISLGWDPKDYDYNFSLLNVGNLSPLAGVETEITVKEEVYREKTTLKVDWIGPREQIQMPEDETTAFVAALRQRLIASRGTPKPSAPIKKNNPF